MPVLLADIGGTNIRFSYFYKGKRSLITKYKCQDYNTISDAIDDYLSLKNMTVTGMILGVAGNVENNKAKLTNAHFLIDANHLKKMYHQDFVYVVNDFVLQGYGVLDLFYKNELSIKRKQNQHPQTKTVIGVGTGLGVSHIVFDEVKNPFICASEAGNSGIACATINQFKIINYLMQKKGYVAFEDILSGNGLCQLYEALLVLNDELINDDEWQNEKEDMVACFKVNHIKTIRRKITKPSDITLIAKCGNEIALLAFWYFFQFLGIFSSSVVLSLKATGGVFFVGDFLKNDFMQHVFHLSQFRLYFENNAKFEDYLKTIPTEIVLQKDTAFIGLSYLAKKQKT